MGSCSGVALTGPVCFVLPASGLAAVGTFSELELQGLFVSFLKFCLTGENGFFYFLVN